MHRRGQEQGFDMQSNMQLFQGQTGFAGDKYPPQRASRLLQRATQVSSCAKYGAMSLLSSYEGGHQLWRKTPYILRIQRM